MHDFTIFKDTLANLDLTTYRLHVDAGFVRIKEVVHCQQVWIPYKVRKGKPLTKM